ncbi:hypothetical protein BDV18DRAFT_162563 [Aspergillus unguis]
MNFYRPPADQGPSQTPSPSYRDKTVTSACERCRKRKIRCDDETPCKTCRRFRLNCVRAQKNDTTSLEQRVQQLEAQIASISSSQGPSLMDFGDVDLDIDSQFLSSPLDIPSIQVDYANTLSPISPISPVSMSPTWPSQSALEGVDTLRPDASAAYLDHLSPQSQPVPSRSRSSSLSSLGWSSAPGDLPTYDPRHWAPTRLQLEALLNRFFDNITAVRYPLAPYPLDRKRLFELLGMLDDLPGRPSIKMARFHVYMVAAVGLKMEAYQSTDVQLYYQLAMEQTRSASFWQEELGVEAAMLVMMFAQASSIYTS